MIDQEYNSLIEEVEYAVDLMNTGKFMQLDGSVGRYCSSLYDQGLIIKDVEKTTKENGNTFIDGYGRQQNLYFFKPNYELIDQLD